MHGKSRGQRLICSRSENFRPRDGANQIPHLHRATTRWPPARSHINSRCMARRCRPKRRERAHRRGQRGRPSRWTDIGRSARRRSEVAVHHEASTGWPRSPRDGRQPSPAGRAHAGAATPALHPAALRRRAAVREMLEDGTPSSASTSCRRSWRSRRCCPTRRRAMRSSAVAGDGDSAGLAGGRGRGELLSHRVVAVRGWHTKTRG